MLRRALLSSCSRLRTTVFVPRLSSSQLAAADTCTISALRDSISSSSSRLCELRTLAESQRVFLRSFSSVPSYHWDSLNQAVQAGNGEEAEAIVDKLLGEYEHQKGVNQQLDPGVFSLVLEAWANSKSPEAAPRAHSLLEQYYLFAERGFFAAPAIEDYHTVLQCWAKHPSNDLDLAVKNGEKLLHTMRQRGGICLPTTFTYDLALAIFARAGLGSRAQAVLDELIHEHKSTRNEYLEPSIATCNLVLKAWDNSSENNAAEAAEALLVRMRKLADAGEQTKIWPNLTSYNTVINCWCTSHHKGSSDRAEALLERMKKEGVRPTALTYNRVISAQSKAGNPEKAERLLSRLIKDYYIQFDADLKPDIRPFKKVLRAWSWSRAPLAAQRAEAFLNHMREMYDAEVLDAKPDLFCYNKVVQCWCQSKHKDAAQRAQDLLVQMQSLGDPDIEPDSSTINRVLKAWVNSANPSQAEQMIWKAYEVGDLNVQLDIISVNRVLDSWANSGNPFQAENLLWKVYDKYSQDPRYHPQPDQISFGTVIKAWARSDSPGAPERAEIVLMKMQELYNSGWKKCKPGVIPYATVINCWAKSKQSGAAENAEAILRHMQELAKAGDTDLEPDVVCWNSVIHAWSHACNGQRAEELLDEMIEDYTAGKTNVKPSDVTFTAVLSAWTKSRNVNNAPERAERLLKRMRRYRDSGVLDIKPDVASYSAVLDCLAYMKRPWAAEKAETILRKMSKSDDPDVRPNIISYNCVLKAWSLARGPHAFIRATALLKEVLAQAEHNCQMAPNINTFGHVLKCLADSSLPDKDTRASSLKALMQKYGVELDDLNRERFKLCTEGNGARRGCPRPNKQITS
jgi:pentatricopeptide repeat protein